MAARKVHSLKKSGRVSVKKARIAAAALKRASAKRAATKKTAARKTTISRSQTATGRHLVSFRVI